MGARCCSLGSSCHLTRRSRASSSLLKTIEPRPRYSRPSSEFSLSSNLLGHWTTSPCILRSPDHHLNITERPNSKVSHHLPPSLILASSHSSLPHLHCYETDVALLRLARHSFHSSDTINMSSLEYRRPHDAETARRALRKSSSALHLHDTSSELESEYESSPEGKWFCFLFSSCFSPTP